MYSLFGQLLASDLDLPDLPQGPEGPPRWSFRRSPPRDETSPAVLVGEAVVHPCVVRLYRTEDGYRIQHLCTGDYFVSKGGDLIEYLPLPYASLDSVRFDLLGRVMALALHTGGWLCLHGSAVELPGVGVVGFIAPKGSGKSTLASVLVGTGGRLVSDDLLVLDCRAAPLALPGIPSLRLHDDSAEHASIHGASAYRDVDGKQVFRGLPEARRTHEPAPLAAIYCLQSVDEGSRPEIAERELLPLPAAASSLVAQGKLASLLGKLETLDVLERALAVARRVPVFRLSVTRDLNRLEDTGAMVLNWHRDGTDFAGVRDARMASWSGSVTGTGVE